MRKLALLYDTANVLARINEGTVEPKHVLYPLLLSYADITVGILPVITRDLSTIHEWEEYLGKIQEVADRNKFDLYKKQLQSI